MTALKKKKDMASCGSRKYIRSCYGRRTKQHKKDKKKIKTKHQFIYHQASTSLLLYEILILN